MLTKKIQFILTTLLFFVFISCENSKKYQILINSDQEFNQFFKEQKYPLISAHRGGGDVNFPENAIETFERTIAFGPSIIETDISMTKDSVLILMHDDRLDRTTNGKGKISNITYEELQSFRLKDFKNNITDFKVPTLEEALKWGKNKVIFTLDIKRGVPYEKVIDAIKNTHSENNVIVITYNANQARAFHRLDSSIWLSVSANSKEDILRLEEYSVSIDRILAFVGTSQPNSQTISYMNSKNIPIIIGTMGNLDKQAKTRGDKLYYDLFSKGIRVISTDRPKQALEQAIKYAKDNNINSSNIVKK